MAPLVLSLSTLPSRAIRLATTGSTGLRTIATRASSNTTSGGGSITGLFGSVFAFGASIITAAFKTILSGLTLTFNALWGLTVRTFGFIWNFNWNVTNKELDEQIKGTYLALAGALGGTVGASMGYAVCGALPGAIIATVNEPLAVQILLNVGELALDELAGHVANVITLTGKSITTTAAATLYKNIRGAIRPDGAKLRAKLVAGGGLSQDKIDKAVAERDKPWSFAIALEEAIESIPNEFLKEFVESLTEEFGEACVETGYVVANTLDNVLPSIFSGVNAVLGGTTTVSIVP